MGALLYLSLHNEHLQVHISPPGEGPLEGVGFLKKDAQLKMMEQELGGRILAGEKHLWFSGQGQRLDTAL